MADNKLFYGDNLEILRSNQIPDESIDLIYIDPPFNSNRDYNIIYDGATAQAEAFKDTWSVIGLQDLNSLVFDKEPQRYHAIHDTLEGFRKILYENDKSLYVYLFNMAVRIVELHRVLKETGSFYLHCDQTAGHYLKVLCDAVFGKSNFQNEVVWCYRRYTAASKRFQRLHDTVFFYKKSSKAFFKEIRVPYGNKSGKNDSAYRQDEDGRWWRWQKRKNQKPYKVYLSEEGVRAGDWWNIPIINSTAKERLGYPTQKPEALLERIVLASCPEGGTVLDAYCGCGTTISVAEKLGRNWIGIDITYLAIELIEQRLLDHYYLGNVENPSSEQISEARKKLEKEVDVFGIPKDWDSAKRLAEKTKNDYVRKEYEKWAVFKVGGVYSEKKGSDGGVDGYFYIHDLNDKGRVEKLKCYIEAKSGKIAKATVKNLKAFKASLDEFNAPIGIFISLYPPTKDAIDYVAELPKYICQFNRKEYPKISIVTVDDIFNETLPEFVISPIRRAKAVNTKEQEGFGFDFDEEEK